MVRIAHSNSGVPDCPVGWLSVLGFRGPGFDTGSGPILISARFCDLAARGTYEVGKI
jgi:hypothetical protein